MPWSRFLLLPTLVALYARAETVGVFLEFEATPSDASVQAMKSEVADLLGESGFLFEWLPLAGRRGTSGFSRVVMMRFTGDCRPAWLRSSGDDLLPFGGRVTLGASKVANGRVLPLTEVRCNEVKKTIAGARGAQERLLGRALGRVAAHELYHVLRNTTLHWGKGFARALQSGAGLTSQRP